MWAALILAIGMLVGAMLKPGSPQLVLNLDPRKDKINEIINRIEEDYVDEVDADSLLDHTLEDLLKSLDPHSSYIPAKELQGVQENIQGSFEGIGVEFIIRKDTIMVVSAISGGPSDQLGIRSGDRIVSVEGDDVAGIGITNDMVIERLRGEKGSKVELEIYRPSLNKTLPFTITRDKIPIYSVDVAYMLEPKVGYIKLNRFTGNSYREFAKALSTLKKNDMEKLVFDLRGNPGGMLQACIQMADEFLAANKMIVYTQGKARDREEYKSSRQGSYEDLELVVLIDEGSASASEIIAGAIQDNDRGLIVGRRSFGKGLVQEPMYLKDGSAIHLTTARFYTPAGRSIQRNYDSGLKAYYGEVYERFDNGELFSADSIDFPDSLKFKTLKGRTVYGGGGIMPDVFVPADTSAQNPWYYAMYNRGGLRDFAFAYADENRETLMDKGLDAYVSKFEVSEEFFQKLVAHGLDKGVRGQEEEIEEVKEKLSQEIKALIARQVWHNEGWYRVFNQSDLTVQTALEIIQKNKGTEALISNAM